MTERRQRLIIFSTHPIQYQAPWFRAIEESGRFDLLVAFSRIPDEAEQAVGFGGAFAWDIPLREGYKWTVLGHSKISWAPLYARRPASGIGTLLREFRPDVALVSGWQELSLLQVIASLRLSGIPLVIRGESNDLKKRSPAARAFHRTLLRCFDSALAIGQANRRFYEAAGFPSGQIVDAPYFVDNKRFEFQSRCARERRSALRALWSIPEDAVVVLFAGKLEPKKRPLDFLEAVRRAEALTSQPVMGLVVGDGEMRVEAQELASRAGIRASFAGFLNQSRIAEAYAASDLLVLPSDHGETWGLVVNEAMAAGLPAIVSDRVGCAHDLVIDGETGLVFPFGDVDTLANSIGRLASNADSRLAMGELAKARVHADYSIERAVDGLVLAADIARRRRTVPGRRDGTAA